ncbi:MAG TPA: tungstate ABC transporter substrate-binding protein WtpA [Desulfobacteraceae bacterium]|nr:tungstate ABC transporter substrate-binding protein WtpA [Desulfobacteraceae bacterium]
MINIKIIKDQFSLKFIFAALCFMGILFISVIPVNAKSGDKLVVFHAGSLAVPFRALKQAFNKIYPDLQIQLEAAGSRTCARKITDLDRPCDVMASADYSVIENLLIPEYADWNISFATNEMAIMYMPDSPYSKEINKDNWYKILLKKDVEYGHSDPNSDPCGYRTLLTWQLAEKYYQTPGLNRDLLKGCPMRNVRPKETDLIGMLEAGQIDYLFIYRSVCEQHKMPFVLLPENISLKSVEHQSFYKSAMVRITGKKPGDFIKKTGKPMVYGITMPKSAPNPGAAVKFISFVVGKKGQEIMKKNGQPPISPPAATGNLDKLPLPLTKLVGINQ